MLIPLFLYSEFSFNRFTLEIENDLFVGEDHGYTHGTKFNFSKYNIYSKNHFSLTNHAFFQFIYTPEYIDIKEPQLNDRPWAGSAAYEFSTYELKDNFFKFSGLQLGVIGPWAMAEQSQKIAHKLTNSTTPLGWDNQLSNRALIGTYWGVGYYYVNSDFFQINQSISYYFGYHLATAGSSVVFRYGRNLKEQHSFVSMEPFTRNITPLDLNKNKFRWNIYAGTEYRYVFYNELITGNENTISLENSVYDVFVGVSLSKSKWSLNYQYILRGREFKEDRYFNGFGRVSLGYNF